MNELDKSRKITASEFDYQALSDQKRSLVMQRTGEIRERLQRSAQDIWEIGQRLADVRTQLGHGQFDSWLKAEFGWSRRTAYNFINVYETFGERANLAQIDIATSALYLLAAPSTPKDLREEYLLKAKEGEKITHKELRSGIDQKKRKSTPKSTENNTTENNTGDSADNSTESENLSLASQSSSQVEQPVNNPSIPNTINFAIPKIVDVESVEVIETQTNESSLAVGKVIKNGWYVLEGQHLVFCGDTASVEFHAYVPDINLAIAVTSNNWDHDWLIDVAANLIVLQETELDQYKLEQLINMFSKPGQTIVFPWLPYKNMIAIASKLNRKIIAGDVSQERCNHAVQSSGLDFASIIL
ncbi:MAG: DUF3102 domain-containing protein [Cyanobacteria bacterium P01_A01_bin.84]